VKLTVIFARYPYGTPQSGYLAAYVIAENSKRGRNLLAGTHITGTAYGKIIVQRELGRLLPGAQIVFEGPEDEAAPTRRS
jgi:hypothetical protein